MQTLDFQINVFIKNIAITSMTNDFNMIDSLEKTIPFLFGQFEKDIRKSLENIKVSYDYETEFLKLKKKYQHKPILNDVLSNILVVKKQSNIDNTAIKIFEFATNDSQEYLINIDRFYKLGEVHLKNYFITVFLSLAIILLVIFALNIYYYNWAKTIQGLIINMSMLLLTLYTSYYLIKKNYTEELYE